MSSRSITGIGIIGLIAWIILKPYINDSGLNWPESVPINYVLIGIGAIAAGIALIKGTWQLSKDKNSVATKKFATGVWVVLIMITIAAMIFGPGAIDRARSDLREVGDNFANRTETSSSASTPERRLTVADINPQRRVRLVACSTGWSQEVIVDPRLRFQIVQDVRGQYLSGTWHEIVGEIIPDLVSKLRFCTSRAERVGTNMGIFWSLK